MLLEILKTLQDFGDRPMAVGALMSKLRMTVVAAGSSLEDFKFQFQDALEEANADGYIYVRNCHVKALVKLVNDGDEPRIAKTIRKQTFGEAFAALCKSKVP